MFFYAPAADQDQCTGESQPDYYSVEFPLGTPQPIYQFKLRRSEQNSFFLLVKEGSDLVSRLKVGLIVPMKYYGENVLRTIDVHETQIVEIKCEKSGRFRGHYRIELDIVSDNRTKAA